VGRSTSHFLFFKKIKSGVRLAETTKGREITEEIKSKSLTARFFENEPLFFYLEFFKKIE